MYLKNLPKFDYNFNKGDGEIRLQVTDLFRRVAFTEETRNDMRNFIEYVIEDGETPDDVAFKIYGDSRWFWVVLLSNNIVNVEKEWPMSQSKVQRRFLSDGYLNGKSIFVEDNRNFKKGDFIVRGDLCSGDDCPDGVTGIEGNYAMIESFDRELMRINVNREGPNFSLSDGDRVFAVRKIQGQDGFSFPFVQAATGCGFGSTSFIAKKVTSIPTGASKFKYGTWNISPYTTATGGGPIPGGPPNATKIPYRTINSNKGLCSDVVSEVEIDDTMLYKYINNQTLDTGFIVKSVEDDMYENEFEKRKIKLVHPRLIGKIYDEFKVLIQSKIARGTTSIITLTA